MHDVHPVLSSSTNVCFLAASFAPRQAVCDKILKGFKEAQYMARDLKGAFLVALQGLLVFLKKMNSPLFLFSGNRICLRNTHVGVCGTPVSWPSEFPQVMDDLLAFWEIPPSKRET